MSRIFLFMTTLTLKILLGNTWRNSGSIKQQGPVYHNLNIHSRYDFIHITCFLSMLPITSIFYSIADRSRYRRCSVKKGVLRNFLKFTGKHLRQRLVFNKVAGLRPATLLKKSFWHGCFPVNFAKFLRKPFLQNTSG